VLCFHLVYFGSEFSFHEQLTKKWIKCFVTFFWLLQKLAITFGFMVLKDFFPFLALFVHWTRSMFVLYFTLYHWADFFWVDYHLMLLPKMLRAHAPDVAMGFFLHIPFPHYDIFRLLPWGREIVDGLLYSNLIGMHTYDYTQNFLSTGL
jgi:hypothetical protein